jgi:hypothetical protein
LEEIAQMRKMTLKTVIKHIRQFINDGILEMSDVFPADRKWVR